MSGEARFSSVDIKRWQRSAPHSTQLINSKGKLALGIANYLCAFKSFGRLISYFTLISEKLLLMRLAKYLSLFFFGFVCTYHSLDAQTIIFTSNGASYNNTDVVTVDNYGPVNIANCSSISFSIDYNFNLPFPGSSNMESSDECTFSGGCAGDPNDPYAGGCTNCWDFFYVQFQVDGVNVNTQLVGVPGSLNQSGTLTFGPICTQSAGTAGFIVQTNTWAGNETITFSNLSITCWDGSPSNLSVNPSPVCAGLPFTLTATLTEPSAVMSTLWTGPGTIATPNNLVTSVTGAPVGTNTYTFTTTDDNACTQSATIDVVVDPGTSMDDPADQIVCAGDQVDVVFTGPGAPTFSWTNSNTAIGLGASGNGDISFTSANVAAPTVATITVTPSENGCIGPNQTFTITVNPLPTVNQPAAVTVCAGAPVSVNLSGTAGATFNWTNDNTAIGLAASGSGNINFTSANVANQEVATITVTPVRNGCPGLPVSFTITVNPSPTVTDPPNQTVCSGAPVDVIFVGTGNPTFNWTNTNPAIGLGASGSGDISFTSANVATATTGTITVTPNANGCPGPNQTFTITVNPTPTVNQPSNVAVCGGAPVNVLFSGTAGAIFSWTNDNTAIGLGASGIGNINFSSTASTTLEVANITVTPSVGGCPGNPVNFTITINPIPTVTDPANQTVCSGSLVDVLFTGTGSPTFNWTNSNITIGLGPAGTGDISFTAATVVNPVTGTITVTPTENGCPGAPQNFTITVSPAPSMNQPSNVLACAGTTVNVAFSGSPGATYSWTNDNTSIGLGASGNGNLNFIAAGVATPQTATITATPMIGSCAGAAVTFTIEINPAPTVVDPPDQTVCAGTPVSVTFTGTNNPTFSWTNNNTLIGLGASGSGNISFTAAAVGVGTVTVTPTANGCTGVAQTFDLTVIASPTVNQPATLSACAGSPVAVTFTGTPGASFAWVNSNTAIGLGASGTGDITFTAANVGAITPGTIMVTPSLAGCTGTALTFDIIINPLPTITIISVSCAPSLLTYDIVLAATNNSLTSSAGVVLGNFGVTAIPSGTNVTLTSTNTVTGCQFQQVVNAPNCNCAPVNAPGAANNPSICEGDVIPALTVTVGAGVTVDWYATPSGGAALLVGNTSYTPPGPFTAGTYSFYAEAREIATNCSSPTRTLVTLTVNAVPSVTQPTDQTVCANASIAINFTGTPSTTMNWTNSNPAIGLGASGTGDILFNAANVTTVQTAQITVTPVLGTCSGTPRTVNVTVNPIPVPTILFNNTICSGTSTTLTVSGGSMISWNTGEMTAAITVSPTTATTYTATVTENGCSATTTATVNVNPTPSVNAPNNQAVCSGSVVAINFNGTGGATFNWTNNNTNIGLGASGSGNINFTATNTGNNPFSGTVVVTPNLNGCLGAAQTFILSINPLPTLTINNTTCSSDLLTYSVNVSTTVATTLTSTAGTVTGAPPTFNVINIPNGTNIILTGTQSATMCSQQVAVMAPNCTCPTVMVPNSPNFPVICEGTATPTLMVNVGAGTTVDWYSAPVGGTLLLAGSNAYVPMGPFTPGSYTFFAEARDVATNCTSATRTPVILTVNAAPTMTQPINQTVCAGFVISVGFNGTSGSSFNWTNSNPAIGLNAAGTGNISFTSVNTGTTPITATISVTPTLLGCDGQPRTFVITVNPSPSVTDPTDVSACVGQSVAVNFSATNGATLSWTNSNTAIGLSASGTGNISFNTTTPGNAVVTVIPTANGCTGAPQTFNIAVISNPNMNNPGNEVACAGDNVVINFSGNPGLNYAWTNSNATIGLPASGTGNLNFIAGNVITVQSAQITVTPTFGACVGQPLSFSITINPIPVASISGATPICRGDAALLTAAGGTNISWAGGQTTASISVMPLTSTTYTATVSANGCSATATATVQVNQPTTATVNQLTCDPTQVGTASNIIPNAAGCDSTITTIVMLDVPNCTPVLNVSNGSVSCFGDSDGVITITAAGGLAPYQYNWSNGTQTGNGQIATAGTPVQLQNLMAGSYTVTITGANGLSQTVTAQVNTPAPLLAQATPVLAFGQYALSCAGVNDATINGMAAGGTAAYQFNWSVAGQQNASLVNVGAGTYTLTVTDAQQCTATSTAVVLDPPPFTFDLTLASVNCGASSATATIAPLNGISPFTVSVDGMIASIGLNPIVPNGNHLISISDGNGCLADTMVEVVLPPVPVITLPAEQVVTLGETLILEAQTNLSSWQSLIWTPQPDSTCVSCLRQEWVPDNSRVYQVAITDTFGCSATASVRVMVKKQFDLYIPNVFSPNLDGIHDFWQLDAGPSVVALNSMRIFDRWGDLVYFWDASIPVDEWPGWDGRTRGEDVNPGVFVYYLEVKLANGEIVEKKGDVTVVR